MKKILAVIATFVMAISIAKAQNYEYVGPFGMPYVSVDAGEISPLKNGSLEGFVKAFKPSFGIEFGTYFTPVWGASIQGIGHINTTGSYTAINQSVVLANGKVNFSNLFAGYNGRPRIFEIVGVVGIGWGHDYGEPKIDPNYVVYNTGAEFNFNIGSSRAFQINVRPIVLWNNYNNDPKFNVDNGRLRLTVGFTYKFGNRRVKSHNFVTNNYRVTNDEYNELNTKYLEALNREPEVREVVREVVKTDTVYVDKVVANNKFSTIITFPVGSSKLTKTEKAKLGVFAKVLNENEQVNIVGSADTKTGTQRRNETLSEERAQTVKDALIELGIPDSRITTAAKFDTNDEPSASRAAVLTVSEL